MVKTLYMAYGLWAMVIHPILGILMGILNPLNAWVTVPLRGKTHHVLTVAQKHIKNHPMS